MYIGSVISNHRLKQWAFGTELRRNVNTMQRNGTYLRYNMYCTLSK